LQRLAANVEVESQEDQSRPDHGPETRAGGQGVPVVAEVDVGTVLVVVDDVDVLVEVEVEVDVLVDVAGSVVDGVLEVGTWVVVVDVVAGDAPAAEAGKVNNAEAQSEGVVAWTSSNPGHAESVNTWSGGPVRRHVNAGSVVPKADSVPTSSTLPPAGGGDCGVRGMLPTPS
jgi:hypothetical protein